MKLFTPQALACRRFFLPLSRAAAYPMPIFKPLWATFFPAPAVSTPIRRRNGRGRPLRRQPCSLPLPLAAGTDAAGRLTVLLVHGLEGSSDSRYIQGITARAWAAGCNVIRMNMRNCGDTEALSPTLYHSGLSGDVGASCAIMPPASAFSAWPSSATPWAAIWFSSWPASGEAKRPSGRRRGLSRHRSGPRCRCPP